jgi:hypothetical protein
MVFRYAKRPSKDLCHRSVVEAASSAATKPLSLKCGIGFPLQAPNRRVECIGGVGKPEIRVSFEGLSAAAGVPGGCQTLDDWLPLVA